MNIFYSILCILLIQIYVNVKFDVVLGYQCLLGPVQTSCFCRAELNSGIKFYKSTAETRRLNQTFELSSASNKVRQKKS